VRLDARTKLLNPKWYEGMMASGYEGVREIQKRLTNTMGWSATAGAVRYFCHLSLSCSGYARPYQCCSGESGRCLPPAADPLRAAQVQPW